MRNIRDIIRNDLLGEVAQPGQYVGLETNARYADVQSADVTVTLAYPDAYTIGISHLGSQELYHRLNDLAGVACDRAYCPLPDAEEVMRATSAPLFGWESRAPLADFDVLGFSLSYEMCATNVLTMLDLAGIPLHAADRGNEMPIVIAGDALADSPEPVAEFFDLFLVGDGEEPLSQLVQIVRAAKARGDSREDILLAAAREIPSAYAPRFHQPHYDSADRFAGLTDVRDDVSAETPHAALKALADAPPAAAPLVPLVEAVHERVVIEIMRGCPNACRFCQAGFTRLPVRIRSVDEIVNAARDALAATGYREISLLSLSTSDYPHLDELIDRLNAEFADRHVSISLPSLRVGSQLKQLPKLTSNVRKGGLTIAAEAGSERLRRAMNKGITEADMIDGVRAAYEAGWRSVKVYFMAGLPGETDEDLAAMVDLCKRLAQTRREVDGHPGSISASVSWFVPKPHTPMQFAPMRDAEYFHHVRLTLRDLARRSPVQFKFHWIERSLLEVVLCRGDRRVGGLIEAAWRNGARFDGWTEHFNNDAWKKAFETTGLDPAEFCQEIPTDAPLPWSHIHCFRSPEKLLAEYARMQEEL